MNKLLKSGVSKSENTVQLALSPINYFKIKHVFRIILLAVIKEVPV